MKLIHAWLMLTIDRNAKSVSLRILGKDCKFKRRRKKEKKDKMQRQQIKRRIKNESNYINQFRRL